MSETLHADETAFSRLDEEDIRLTTGFADIFTTIVLVIGATALLAGTGLFGALLVIGGAFALGTPIVRVRGFASSSSALAIGVAFGAGAIGTSQAGILGTLIAAGASAFYWRTFRVPMALALAWAGVGALIAFLLTAGFQLGEGPGIDFGDGTVFGLACGGQLLAAALWYDSRDRARRTRLSDVAFWLHFAAAPLLVHGLFAALGANPLGGEPANPWTVLAIFAGLTLVSLVIDRRPLLVSSFIYLLVAVATLLTWSRPSLEAAERLSHAALAPAVIGIFLLVLAAGWSPLRKAILAPLPDVVTRFVPPPSLPRKPPQDHVDLPPAEKEPLRLVLGFNDIFVSLGSTMLFIGSIAFAYFVTKPHGTDPLAVLLSATPWLMVALPASSLWLVAEYFVRVRRMAWPAVTTAVWFWVVSCAAGLLVALTVIVKLQVARVETHDALAIDLQLRESFAGVGTSPMLVPIACATAVIANLLFWWRHRTPLSFMLAIASVLPLLFIDLIGQITLGGEPAGKWAWFARSIGAGLAVLGLALLWDRSDRERRTQRSDTAFWLHLLASMLVIPPLLGQAMQFAPGPLLVAALFVAIVGIAVAIDRRAPLVVAFPFATSAAGELPGSSAMATVVVSLALLGLVLRWDQVRGWMLSLMPRAVQA